ncbi:hypothetical protein HDU96_001266 [Phlyctochytrium bullatum]|nr:hypothetical protein HDU96_001266 [Phlyctochytrium bullatum]
MSRLFASEKLRRWLRFAGVTGQCVCVTLLVQQYVGEITMNWHAIPTFNIGGDLVLVEYITWKWQRKLERGDVVVALSPLNPHRAICKRVLGLPGDKVLVDPSQSVSKFVTVPKGHVWLQGDNLNNSTDSRTYGPVPLGLLRGKVYAKLFPEFKLVENGFKDVAFDDDD